MVDVLLTHSYHLFYDPKQVRKMQPYPPLGTLYAAALLRRLGFSVALFDTMLEEPRQGFAAALARAQPRVVALYEDNFNFLSKMCLTRMRRVAYEMLDGARAAGAKVVANGSDASDHVEEYLERGFDYILLGEAEWTLAELVEYLLGRAGKEPESIPGITFLRQGSGEVFRASLRPPLRDLDTLPLPARDLIEPERYRDAWREKHGYYSLNLVASRGCPYRCNWCARPIYGDSFHVRAAESVAEEMRELGERYGADHLWFADDVFALKPRWAQELAEAIERRQFRIPFKIQSRVNLMTGETVAALKRAGCSEVWMGVESGSQRILDSMEKGTRVEQIYAARENLRQHGIRAGFFLQFGYPGEAWEDIERTIGMVRATRPDDIGVSVSYPLPGTKFYDTVRAQLGEKRNWVDSDDLAMIFQGSYTNDFYRALRDALHAEVDSWQADGKGANGSGNSAGRARGLWATVYRMEKTCSIPQTAPRSG